MSTYPCVGKSYFREYIMTPTSYQSSENSGTTRGTANGPIYVASDQGTNTIGTANEGPKYIPNK
jgi:hypothetical protein